jgi:hypothetical protein
MFPIRWDVTLSYRLFILGIRNIITTGEKDFNHNVFIEFFTMHHLRKNSRFYHLPNPRYIRNKKMLQHYGHPVVKKYVTVFSNVFLYFTLHSMLNINILKDVPHSGLSPYI